MFLNHVFFELNGGVSYEPLRKSVDLIGTKSGFFIKKVQIKGDFMVGQLTNKLMITMR